MSQTAPAELGITQDAVYRRLDEVVTRSIVGETLLVPVSGTLANLDDLFTLNSTGAYVWGRLDGATSLAAIRDGLASTFEVETERAWADLVELTVTLLDAGLIEKEDPT